MLAGKGLTELGSFGTGGSHPVSIASAVRLDLAMGSLPGPSDRTLRKRGDNTTSYSRADFT